MEKYKKSRFSVESKEEKNLIENNKTIEKEEESQEKDVDKKEEVEVKVLASK